MNRMPYFLLCSAYSTCRVRAPSLGGKSSGPAALAADNGGSLYIYNIYIYIYILDVAAGSDTDLGSWGCLVFVVLFRLCEFL